MGMWAKKIEEGCRDRTEVCLACGQPSSPVHFVFPGEKCTLITEVGLMNEHFKVC